MILRKLHKECVGQDGHTIMIFQDLNLLLILSMEKVLQPV